MRDPDALHVGLAVLTPDGPGIIRARRGGPVTTWLAGDRWWRESQLTVPEQARETTTWDATVRRAVTRVSRHQS